MPRPITLVDSGGMPITEATEGEPMTLLSGPIYGEPMTLVDNGGIPVVLVNDDYSLYVGWEAVEYGGEIEVAQADGVTVTYYTDSAENDWNIQRARNLNYWRFEVRSGDQSANDIANLRTAERAELSATFAPLAQPGEDFWFSDAFWYESDTPVTTDWLIHGQLHARNTAGAHPVFKFETTAGTEERVVTATSLQDPMIDNVNQDVRLADPLLETGKVYYRVGRIRLNPDGTGELDVYIDGVQVVRLRDFAFGYLDDGVGNFWKFGIYREAKNETTVCYLANVEIGSTDLSDRIANPLPLPIPAFSAMFARPSSSSLEEETLALVARMTTAPSEFEETAIDRWWKRAKTSTFPEKLDAHWDLASHAEQPAQRNWISDFANLSPTGSPTFTVGGGYQGNGTSQDLSTGIALTALSKGSQDNFHMGLWLATSDNNAGAASFDMGTDRAYIARSAGGNLAQIRGVQSSGTITAPAGTNFPAHVVFNRTSASTWEVYRNGVLMGTGTDASAAFNATLLYLLRVGGVGRGVNRVLAAHIGAAFTADEAAEHHNATRSRLLSCGAIAS